MTHTLPARRTTSAYTVTLHRAAQEQDGRRFTGIAVPWDSPIDLYDGTREQFAPGSIEADNPLLCWRHDEPIGRISAHQDTEDGWQIDADLSDTTQARDASTLLRDGVITKLSIGFEPIEWRIDRDEDGNETITYTRARVLEVSLVPFPAYPDATITELRHQPTRNQPKEHPTMTPADELTMPEIRSALDELNRKIELGTTTSEKPAHPLAHFRSLGDYVKAAVAGDERAIRAYTGLTTGDLNLDDAPAWANKAVTIIEARTPTLAMVNHTRDLPAEGLTVPYGQVTLDNGLTVAEQLKEGDDLVFGKLGLKAGLSAEVRTIGGWTDMSRQVIERAPVNVVDLMWRAFAVKYGETLEAIAKAALTDLYNARVSDAGNAVITGDLTTANGVIDLLVELADRFDDSPYSLDVIWLGKDAFKTLAKIDEAPKALQLTAAPTDKLGTATISGLEAKLSNVTVKLWSGAPTGTAAFATDTQAIRVQESPGAPFRLQDENIVNLSKQFSVYGYVAAWSEFPEALVPIIAG